MKNDYAAKERSERAERSLDSKERMVLTNRGLDGKLCLQYFWLSKVIGCRRVAGGKCNSDVATRAIDREEKKVRLIISPDGTPYPRHLNYF